MQLYIALHFNRKGSFDFLEAVDPDVTPEEYLRDADDEFPDSSDIKFVEVTLPEPPESQEREVKIVAKVELT